MKAMVERSGCAFKANKYYMFSARRQQIVVLRSWPPKAWRKTRTAGWVHFRPDVKIPSGDLQRAIERLRLGCEPQAVFPFMLASLVRADMAWLEFWQEVPRELRDVAAQYRSRHWHVLSLLARVGEPALDLARTNPALGFLLANSWVFKEQPVAQPMRSARALLRQGRKQRDILTWLDFPPTARRMLAKFVPEAIEISPLLYFRDALRDSPAAEKALSHLPRINRGALRIATDPDLLRVCSPHLLREVASDRGEDRCPETAALMRDVLEMADALNQPALRIIRDANHLLDLHEDFVDRLNSPSRLSGGCRFGRPPIPGKSEIVPISDEGELYQEGREQHNCVAWYADSVRAGCAFVYKTVAPLERCTVAITRTGCGSWRLAEIKAARNRPAAEPTVAAVRAWLASVQGRECDQETLADEIDHDVCDIPF